MTEEIRSYLLNSPSYSDYVYFPERYVIKPISAVQTQFRSVVLGLPSITDKRMHAWRVNILVSGIYKDRQLSDIAMRLFDKRILESRNTIVQPLEDRILINSKDERIIIFSDTHNSVTSLFSEKQVTLRPSSSSSSLEASIIEGKTTVKNTINFNFSNGASEVVSIHGSPLKVAFRGTNKVPDDFVETVINITYSCRLNVNDLIEQVDQIPGIDQMMWTNQSASAEILPTYVSTDKGYKKLLCMLMAYAISVKAL